MMDVVNKLTDVKRITCEINPALEGKGWNGVGGEGGRSGRVESRPKKKIKVEIKLLHTVKKEQFVSIHE